MTLLHAGDPGRNISLKGSPTSSSSSGVVSALFTGSAIMVSNGASAEVIRTAERNKRFFGDLVQLVGSSGADTNLIAIRDALPSRGGRVYLTEGSYSFSGVVDLNKPMIVQGAGADTSAAGQNHPTRIDAPDSAVFCFIVSGDGVEIRDLGIIGNGTASGAIQVVSGAFRPRVTNVTIENFSNASGKGLHLTNDGSTSASLINGVYTNVQIRECAGGNFVGEGNVSPLGVVNNHTFVQCESLYASSTAGQHGVVVGTFCAEWVWIGGGISRCDDAIRVTDNVSGPYFYGTNIESNNTGFRGTVTSVKAHVIASFKSNTTKIVTQDDSSYIFDMTDPENNFRTNNVGEMLTFPEERIGTQHAEVVVNWENLSGVATRTSGSGTAELGETGLAHLRVPQDAVHHAGFETRANPTGGTTLAFKDEQNMYMRLLTLVDAFDSNIKFFIGFRDTLGNSVPSTSEAHVGIIWDGTNLKFSSSDGSNSNTQNFSTPSTGAFHQYVVAVVRDESSTRAKGWVDTEALTELGTEVPTGGDQDWQVLLESDGNGTGGTFGDMTLGQLRLTQDL